MTTFTGGLWMGRAIRQPQRGRQRWCCRPPASDRVWSFPARQNLSSPGTQPVPPSAGSIPISILCPSTSLPQVSSPHGPHISVLIVWCMDTHRHRWTFSSQTVDPSFSPVLMCWAAPGIDAQQGGNEDSERTFAVVAPGGLLVCSCLILLQNLHAK